MTYRLIDKGIIEILGPAGSNIWQEWATTFQIINSGHLFHSAHIILLATIVLLMVTPLNPVFRWLNYALEAMVLRVRPNEKND